MPGSRSTRLQSETLLERSCMIAEWMRCPNRQSGMLSRIWMALIRKIVSQGIFLDHAPGIELCNQGHHGPANFCNPPPRYSGGIPVIEARNHFILQNPVEAFAVFPVLLLVRTWVGIIP